MAKTVRSLDTVLPGNGLWWPFADWMAGIWQGNVSFDEGTGSSASLHMVFESLRCPKIKIYVVPYRTRRRWRTFVCAGVKDDSSHLQWSQSYHEDP